MRGLASRLRLPIEVPGTSSRHFVQALRPGTSSSADDNAKGVLALLSLAKSLIESPPERADRRTVVFVAWGIEEDPFYVRGSKAFFEQLAPGSAEQIVHYVNFDMIGHDSDHGMLYALGTDEESPARAMLQARGGQYGEVQIDLGERGQSSDHVTFCENEIPYTFFWAEDACYHQPCDTPGAIDNDHLPDILRAGRDLVADLSIAPDLATPRSSFATDDLAEYPTWVTSRRRAGTRRRELSVRAPRRGPRASRRASPRPASRPGPRT